jgi:hypothetical protein
MNSMTQAVDSFPTIPVQCGTRPADQPSNHPRDHRRASDLRLEFHKTSLGTLLNYFRETVGLLIHASSSVPMERKVDLWHDQPVNRADALLLLKQALIEKGCMLIQRGPLFSIIRSQDAKKNYIPLPVI